MFDILKFVTPFTINLSGVNRVGFRNMGEGGRAVGKPQFLKGEGGDAPKYVFWLVFL